MKNAIRIISLLLVLVMCIGVFAACGGGESEKNDDKPGTEGNNPSGDTEGDTDADTDTDTDTDDDTDIPTTPGDGENNKQETGIDLTFGGESIKFLVCNGDEATKDLPGRSIWVDPTDADALSFEVNAKVVDRNKTVEEKLDVKISMETCEQGETQSKVTDLLAAGMHEYDVIGAYQYYDMGLTIGDNGGFFVNFEGETVQDDIHIDITKPYWDKNIYDLLTYGGCAFWVTGDISQTWVASVFVSFVNGKLWEQYADVIKTCPAAKGISDPFELVEQGLWTIDLWNEISKAIYADNNSNEIVDIGDTVGFITYKPALNNIMADGLAAGAGVQFSKAVNGKWEMDMANNKVNTLFANKLVQLYNAETQACQLDWSDEKYIMEEFADGNGLMTVNLLHMSEHYLSNMESFYVLPVPKLMSGTSTSYTTTTHDNLTLFGVPATAVEKNKLGAITATLEQMACESYNMVTPAYYNNVLKTRYNHAGDAASEKQSAMIDTIRGAVTHDFASVYGNLIGGKSGAGAPTHFFRTECGKAQFVTSVKNKNTVWSTGLAGVLEDIEAAYYMERT